MARYSDVNGLIGVIYRYIQSFGFSQVEKYGITPPQFDVLRALWKEDGLIMSELGRRTARDRPTITGIADRMEKKNLVVRKRTIRDRRIVRVYLTTKGWQVKEDLVKIQQEISKHIAVPFTDEHIRVLEVLLHLDSNEADPDLKSVRCRSVTDECVHSD